MNRTVASLITLIVLISVAWLGHRAGEIRSSRRDADRRSLVLPDTFLVALDGKPAALRDQGPRGSLLVFFTTWCRYCDKEVRDLLAHVEAFEGVDVVLISPEPVSHLDAYGRSVGLPLPGRMRLLHDSGAALARSFHVRSVPSAFVYDAAGHRVATFEGLTSSDAMADAFLTAP